MLRLAYELPKLPVNDAIDLEREMDVAGYNANEQHAFCNASYVVTMTSNIIITLNRRCSSIIKASLFIISVYNRPRGTSSCFNEITQFYLLLTLDITGQGNPTPGGPKPRGACHFQPLKLCGILRVSFPVIFDMLTARKHDTTCIHTCCFFDSLELLAQPIYIYIYIYIYILLKWHVLRNTLRYVSLTAHQS